MRLALLLVCIAIATFGAVASADPASNIILVTVDGLRWQEVFRGADERLLKDERFTPKDYRQFEPHQRIGADAARKKLMPFFWSTIVEEGSVLGDRDRGNRMRVTNPWWFSYPGYNEILTGRADPKIDSNDKRLNANVTVLEYLNRRADFRNRVQAFGSWDVFPYIINSERSGIPVNVSGKSIVGTPTQREQWLQQLQSLMPLAFPAVRHDAFTHQHALEALQSDQPRIAYVAYGEPDDFAHAGKYGEYLDATHRFDVFLRELWEFAQSHPAYRGRTAMIVTTDHGRGELPLENWQHHSSKQAMLRSDPNAEAIEGSEQIWAAALGAGVATRGVIIDGEERTQSQFASTILKLLNLDPAAFDSAAGSPLHALIERK